MQIRHDSYLQFILHITEDTKSALFRYNALPPILLTWPDLDRHHVFRSDPIFKILNIFLTFIFGNLSEYEFRFTDDQPNDCDAREVQKETQTAANSAHATVNVHHRGLKFITFFCFILDV